MKCKENVKGHRCQGTLKKGTAFMETMTDHGNTVGGGRIVTVVKCGTCGHSVSFQGKLQRGLTYTI